MTTKTIDKLSKLKKEFPLVIKEAKDLFKTSNKNIKLYELDTFVYNDITHCYYLTMSSGHAECLDFFDMKGEILEDEISVDYFNFSENESSGEDVYDTEDLVRGYNDSDLDDF